MSEVKVGENESESALRRFKRKCSRSGVLSEVRKGTLRKPSVRRKSLSCQKKKEKILIELEVVLCPQKQTSRGLKQSMKEKDTIKKSSITMVRAAILQIEKDNKIELTDDDIIEVIAKQVKKEMMLLRSLKVDRQDLVEQTNAEIEVLTKYLPSNYLRMK